MVGFGYLCILLFIIIFILYLFKKNLSSSPSKVKLFIAMVLVPLLLRMLVLICAIVIEKQSIIYLLRYFVFLNFISIPLLVLGCLFIFLRDERIKFKTNYIFLVIFLVGYIYLIIFYKIDININVNFGFTLNIRDSIFPTLIYLIIIATLTIVTLLFIDKPYSNRNGMRILLVSLIIGILEYVFFLGGVQLFPYPLVGEIFILISTLKAIETFK